TGEAAAFQRRPDDNAAQVGGGEVLQRAEQPADRRPGAAGDHRFWHGPSAGSSHPPVVARGDVCHHTEMPPGQRGGQWCWTGSTTWESPATISPPRSLSTSRSSTSPW